MGNVIAFPFHRITHRLAHTRPLPVAWDGHPVTWKPWERIRRPFICGGTRSYASCDKCGHTDYEHQWQAAGVTHGPRPTRLWAYRCEGCGHDVVAAIDPLEIWDLDETDYGPTGSNHPNPTPETLF